MSAAVHDTPTRRSSMMMTTTAAVKKEGGVIGGTAPPPRKRHRVDINDMVEESIDAESMMTHMQPEIKNEPSLDIDNTEEYTEGGAAEEEEENTNGSSNGVPKIRLTPTAKLMPIPNPADPKRKFVCPYENCTKSYGKSSHLRSHLTWHTGIKPFVCQEANCGKGFTRSDELNRHIRTHTGEKPFECVQCTKKFSRSDHLTKHLATHAKQMLNPSPKRAADDKKKKINIAVPEFAESMHFLGPFVDNVLQGNETPATTQHQPIKIKLEKPHHSNEYQVVPASENSALESNNRHEEKADSSSPELNDDDAIMPEANAEPLSDDMMNANNIEDKFGVPAHLAQFIERPFRCTLYKCTKAFKRQDDLSRHLRTHTGEKPFACTYEDCDKRFVRSDHMKKHLKTHFKHPTPEELAAEVQQTATTTST